MSYFHAGLLSIVEGITEFLPISSTGHLILAGRILSLDQTEFMKSFEIIIQLGAILAVIILYWKTLLSNTRVWQRILIAFAPTAILGFSLYKYIKHFLLGNTSITLVSLFIGGIVLILLEKAYREEKYISGKIEKLSYKKAFLIGLFQSISMIPGVSRAAATIFGGLFLGLPRKNAVEFSFLLAIPTMLAAAILDIYKSHMNFTSYEYSFLTIGFLGSFVTAYFTVKYFLKYIQSHTFIPFGIYRIVLAILFFLMVG
ncbi:undecaprenyl-diphosphatase UppP [Candidatus Gottesmanbacteria bacterium]|nr:undecaprenyl-diphosphatase UppP [Candidatus Gottesmanbacteria bacterium]